MQQRFVWHWRLCFRRWRNVVNNFMNAGISL
jgi:hypothetical protein